MTGLHRSLSLLGTLSLLGFFMSCSQDPVVDGSGDPGDSAQADAACSHPICSTGSKLKSSCDPCVAKICAKDPYCCNTSWSSLCVKEVGTICGESCTGGNPDMRGGGSPDMRGGNPDMRGGGSPDLRGGGGGVGANGGSVDHLFFAVVGDSRPANQDDTANYPTAIINKIYADIEAMSPRPQFVISTGDYQYASTTGGQNATQLGLYVSAAKQFTGVLFAAMGNHECDGFTADNCAGKTTANLTAFLNAMVKPLGKTLPYYSVPITALDGSWTAKVLIVACNDWDSTQQSWLSSDLATT